MKETIKKFGAWLLAATLAFTGAGAAMAETVAKIGETPYESLAAAIAEATAGQTVEIVLAGDYTLPGINKEITVKAAKDVAVNVPLKAVSGGTMGSFNGVTFEGMTFTVDKNVDYTGINLGADQRVSFVNCTFHRRLTTYGSMICTGCTFNQDGADYCITAYGPYDKEHELKFTNCTFNNTNKGKFLNLYNQNRKTYDVTIEGCTFDNKGTESKAAILIKEIAPNNVFGCFNVYIKGTNTLKGLFPSGIYETEVTAAGGNGLWANEGANPPTEYVTVFVNGLEVYPHAAVPEIEVVTPTVSEEKGITQEIVNQITTNPEVAKVEDTGLKAALAEDEELKDAEAVVKVELTKAAPTTGVLTYEIKPVVKGEGESPDEDISAKVVGKPITFRVPLTDAFSDVAKVTHKGTVDEISRVRVQGAAGSRYVELTFVHFSEVEIEPEDWPDATPVKIGDTFYASLGEAIKAGVADAEILCKPGATIPVGSNVHEPFLKSTTIYGNGAVLASSSEYSLGSIPADGSTYSIKVFNLGKIGLWDAVKAGVKIDILVEDCQDVHEVQIQVQNGGSSSVVNTVVRNCTFDMVNGSAHMSGVSQDCGGSVLVEGCSFNGLLCGVNVKNDVGALTTTVKDCTFVDCGLVGNEWNKESNTNLGAPIRVGSKEGATNAAIIENNEISYAAGSQKILEGDVIIGDNRPGKDAAGEVTYTVSGTAAKVDVYPVHGKLSGDEADAFTKDAEKSVVLTVTESAEGKNESKAYAAYIGTQGYETIQAAVDAAANIEEVPVTITIMGGVYEETIDLTKKEFTENDVEYIGGITLEAADGADVTLTRGIFINEQANLSDIRIKGLTISPESDIPVYLDTGSNKIIRNIEVANCVLTVSSSASDKFGVYLGPETASNLTIKDCTINGASNWAIDLAGKNTTGLIISGNTIQNGSDGIALFGALKDASVTDNTLKGGVWCALWDNNESGIKGEPVDYAGNTIVGDPDDLYAVVLKKGDLTRSDIAIGEGNTFNAESIEGWALPEDGAVVISNLAAAKGYSVYFNHKLYLGDETAFKTLEAAVAADTSGDPLTIVNYDSSMKAPEGWEFKTEGGVTKLVKKVVAVAKVIDAEGNETTYPTLQAAIAAVPTDGTETTIKMIADDSYTGKNPIAIAAGKKVVIDLNGFTVSYVSDNATNESDSFILNKGDLTVTDTSESKLGKITAKQNVDWMAGAYTINNSGNYETASHFVLEAGTIENTSAAGLAWPINNGVWGTKADTVINGGTVHSVNYVPVRQYYQYGGTKTLTINGGTFVSDNSRAIAIQCNDQTIAETDSYVKVNGGTFSCNGSGMIYFDLHVANINTTGAAIEVKGGTFSNANADAPAVVVDNEGKDQTSAVLSSKFIAGGTYSKEPAADMIAEGYEAVAQGTTPETWKVQAAPVCQIGETKYPSIAAAVAVVPTDGTKTTIKMIANEAFAGDEGKVAIASTKNVVLDLNGCTLSYTSAGYGAFISNNGTLEITDTSVEKLGKITAQFAKPDWMNGCYTIDNGNDTNGKAVAKLTITAGTIENTSDAGLAWPINNGSWNSNAETTINGGTIHSVNYVPVRQYLHYAGSKKLVINGGTFISDNSRAVAVQFNDASVQESEASVIINGGDFSCNGSGIFYMDLHQANVDTTGLHYEVNGGKFKNANKTVPVVVYDDEGYSQTTAKLVTKFIKGGIFSAKPADDTIADGYEAVENTDAETKDAYPWTIGEVAAAVAQIGDVTYPTLAAAVAAVPTDGTKTTIKIIADHTIDMGDAATGMKIEKGQNIVLDLNGKKIIGVAKGGTTQLIDNYGKLTVTDTADKVEGKFAGSIVHGANPAWVYDGSGSYSGSYASNLIRNYGEVIINGGHLENASIAGQSGGAAYVVDNSSNAVQAPAKLTINDGELVAAWTAVRSFANNATYSADIEVKGGSITAVRNAILVNSASGNSHCPATLKISGGTLTSTRANAGGSGGVIQLWNGFKDGANTRIDCDITGGMFSGGEALFEFDGAAEIENVAVLCVSGGLFNKKVPSTFIADGYVCASNPDDATKETYPWKVQEPTVTTKEDAPIVIDISGKTEEDPSTEAVEVPVTVTQELANEILNEIMGQSVNVTQPLTEAQVQTIVTQLETKGEDGMTGWQKYAAGFSQTDKHPLAPKGKGTDDGKLVLVTSLITPKQLSVDTGVKVKYILMQGSNVNQATGLPTAWTKVQELPTPEFPVDVTQLDPETYWKIDVEYTATRVVETEVEPAN